MRLLFLAGEPAVDVLKDACQDLMLMCQQVRGTFVKAVEDFNLRNPKPVKDIQNKGDKAVEDFKMSGHVEDLQDMHIE